MLGDLHKAVTPFMNGHDNVATFTSSTITDCGVPALDKDDDKEEEEEDVSTDAKRLYGELTSIKCWAHRVVTGIKHAIAVGTESTSNENAKYVAAILGELDWPSTYFRASPSRRDIFLEMQTTIATENGDVSAAFGTAHLVHPPPSLRTCLQAYAPAPSLPQIKTTRIVFFITWPDTRWLYVSRALIRALRLRKYTVKVTAAHLFLEGAAAADYTARVAKATSPERWAEVMPLIVALDYISVWVTVMQSRSTPTLGLVLPAIRNIHACLSE